ncbi:MAG: acyl-CoA dehydratase activase [Bacillota bacterium]|jgi:predicted CoA-substrate-specific enzyme activase|nr:2-hydroxyglutaryl-CoA dehydratase [Clostridia bacterium]
MNGFLGIDVGSVSTNLVVLDESGAVKDSFYLRTQGQPIKAIKTCLNMAVEKFPGLKVLSVGTTGSARHLASVIVGADTVKNEITAHAVAASSMVPGVRTVIEIGGQDSKLIILRNGVVTDFAMNTVCAAGTGSFLDQQAARLGIPIEQFGEMARRATIAVRIAGRCAVFAESDMIHKQQMGYSLEDIGAGLCEALVRNFLNNLGKGKEILSPIVFQGGVAANVGMRDAFAKALATEIIVPEYFGVMGAVGAAILAREYAAKNGRTMFRGFSTLDVDFNSKSIECSGCPNQCEVVAIQRGSQVLARWGDRCGKWSGLNGSLINEELAEA